MKATLTITREIWKPAARRKIIAERIKQNALTLESKIKVYISSGSPSGVTYRRGAIVRAKSRAKGLPLRSKGKGAVVGFNFHRASRAGEPPAVDTGALLNSIRARQILQLKYRVGTTLVYAAILDAPDGLKRPFFKVNVTQFKPVFFADMRACIRELLGK